MNVYQPTNQPTIDSDIERERERHTHTHTESKHSPSLLAEKQSEEISREWKNNNI